MINSNSPRSTRVRRSVVALTAASLLATVAAGCGGTNHRTAATGDSNLKPLTAHLQPMKAGQPVGPLVTVPSERGDEPIQPYADLGTQVVITPSGLEPRILESNYNLPITWTNLTTSVQRITFTSPTTLTSPPIPPGGKWSYTAKLGGNLHVQTGYGAAAVVDFS